MRPNWELAITCAALLGLGVAIPSQASQEPQTTVAAKTKSKRSDRLDRKRAEEEAKLERHIAQEEEKLEKEQQQGRAPLLPGYSGPEFNRRAAPTTPPGGQVQVETLPAPDAQVFVDGGYKGTVGPHGSFALRPGLHNVEIKSPSGKRLYDQEVFVLPGHTTRIFP